MPDAIGNATTRIKCGAGSGRTPTAGAGRHKLMTKELGDTIPALYANENVEDYDSVLAPAKLFSPCAPRDAA